MEKNFEKKNRLWQAEPIFVATVFMARLGEVFGVFIWERARRLGARQYRQRVNEIKVVHINEISI